MRTRMNRVVDLKSGKLIGEFDRGAFIVPSIVNEMQVTPSPPRNMRTRMKRVIDLKSGKLIGEFDRGAFIVPSIVNKGKQRQGKVPLNQFFHLLYLDLQFFNIKNRSL